MYNTYIYIYIYYVFMYLFIYLFIYVFIYLFIHIHIPIHMYIYIIYNIIYIIIYIYIYIYILYILIYIYIYIHTYICTYIYIYVCRRRPTSATLRAALMLERWRGGLRWGQGYPRDSGSGTKTCCKGMQKAALAPVLSGPVPTVLAASVAGFGCPSAHTREVGVSHPLDHRVAWLL